MHHIQSLHAGFFHFLSQVLSAWNTEPELSTDRITVVNRRCGSRGHAVGCGLFSEPSGFLFIRSLVFKVYIKVNDEVLRFSRVCHFLVTYNKAEMKDLKT